MIPDVPLVKKGASRQMGNPLFGEIVKPGIRYSNVAPVWAERTRLA
jgi:hypothetical protein